MTTTVISRAYADERSAIGIQGRLYRQGFPRHQITVVSPNGETTQKVTERLTRALMPEDAAKTYAARIADGASVVIVRATYKPLGAVRIANETFATSGALDIDLDEEQFRVPTPKDHAPSILKDHPLFLTMRPRGDVERGTMSEQFGLRLLSARKTRHSVISGGKLMLGGRVKTGRVATSAKRGGGYMSRAFWPMPLLSKKKRGLSVTRDGGHPLSRLLGWPTTS